MGPIQIFDERELPPGIEAAIRRTLVECFPADAEFFARSRAWHGSEPAFSVLMEQAGRVIAHLGAVERRVSAGAREVDVAGLQNVCVVQEYRGRGLCRALLARSMEEARRRGLDFGLLFCVAALVPLYGGCGWRRLPEESVVRIDSDGREKPLAKGNLPMYYPLAGREFPPGLLHLNGNDW